MRRVLEYAVMALALTGAALFALSGEWVRAGWPLSTFVWGVIAHQRANDGFQVVITLRKRGEP